MFEVLKNMSFDSSGFNFNVFSFPEEIVLLSALINQVKSILSKFKKL